MPVYAAVAHRPGRRWPGGCCAGGARPVRLGYVGLGARGDRAARRRQPVLGRRPADRHVHAARLLPAVRGAGRAGGRARPGPPARGRRGRAAGRPGRRSSRSSASTSGRPRRSGGTTGWRRPTATRRRSASTRCSSRRRRSAASRRWPLITIVALLALGPPRRAIVALAPTGPLLLVGLALSYSRTAMVAMVAGLVVLSLVVLATAGGDRARRRRGALHACWRWRCRRPATPSPAAARS